MAALTVICYTTDAMSDTKPEQTQQEFFPEFTPGQPKGPERLASFHRTPKPILVTTSVEQIVLTGILVILAGCLVFFLGVLRGRSIGHETAAPQRLVVVPLPAKKPETARQVPVFQSSPAQPPSVKIEARTAQAADPTKPYTLQLITYKKRDLAEGEAGELRRRGFQAFVAPSGNYFLVCSGQYGSKEESARDQQALRARYKDCFLRRR